ncbi:MAG: hypothetical protein WA099_02685 [Sulfuricurvum sp.]
MKKVRFFVLSIIAVAGVGLTGCSNSPKILEPQIMHDKTKPTGKTIVKTPALNSIGTVEVGENMYQKVNTYLYDTYNVVVIKPEKIHDDNWIDIKGTSSILYKWTSSDLNTICRPDKSRCWVDANKTNAFTYDFEDLHDVTDMAMQRYPVEYKLIPTPPTYDMDSFKYQALYQGRIDNKIKISFREFKDDMARPAFTQDIEYELNKSGDTIVGFKGLRIKILKATNMDITYSVIQDYN